MTDKTQPEALRLALSIDLMDTFTDYQQDELNKAAAELRRQHARIAELEAELEAIGAGGVQALSAVPARDDRVPEAWTNLLAYVLQDDLHNRLTPRVIDIAYTAFNLAKQPNTEDGGASDWFNDTKPAVAKMIAKLRKDLIEDRAASPTPPAEQPIGELVVTKTRDGQIVSVTRQDDEGRILSVIATSDPAEQQAASSAVLKAIREANMQLVRTGDDAFMLVPYKVATTEAVTPKGGATTGAALGGVYAELPEPFRKSGAQVQADVETSCTCHLFCIEQMRDFADRTHALRMEQVAPKAAPGEPDPADIIAGALQISRGHAIEMMREALEAAPRQEAQEPVSPRHPVVMQWRDNAIEACAKIADAYGHEHAAQDMRAMLTAPQPAPAPLSEREAFERDWEKRNAPVPINGRTRDDGRYVDTSIQNAWESWKARAALAAQGGKA